MRLVDADALLRTIESIERGNAELIEFYLETKVLLGNAPTIDAEPVRHGRWVKRGSRWQCTHCKVLMDIDGTPEENLLNYCTYCGTKMDGKEVNN